MMNTRLKQELLTSAAAKCQYSGRGQTNVPPTSEKAIMVVLGRTTQVRSLSAHQQCSLLHRTALHSIPLSYPIHSDSHRSFCFRTHGTRTSHQYMLATALWRRSSTNSVNQMNHASNTHNSLNEFNTINTENAARSHSQLPQNILPNKCHVPSIPPHITRRKYVHPMHIQRAFKLFLSVQFAQTKMLCLQRIGERHLAGALCCSHQSDLEC
jgi:hypothetical protein